MKNNLMKPFLSLLFSGFIFVLAGQGKIYFSGGNVCEDRNWELVFEDNFDTQNLDKDKWICYYPDGKNGTDSKWTSRMHDRNELQIYRDENVTVENGLLNLIVKDEVGEWFGETRNYSAGMIWSKQKIDHYAKYEIRCKIPKGKGFFPAFWALAHRAETEIDIFEFGTQFPRKHIVGIINWETGKILHNNGIRYNGVDFSEDFHVFSVEYDKYHLKFYVDGVEVHSIDKYKNVWGGKRFDCKNSSGYYKLSKAYPPPEQPLNVIANVAVGGPFTDPPDETTPFPAVMEVDYIRVYRRADCTANISRHIVDSDEIWNSDRLVHEVVVKKGSKLKIQNASIDFTTDGYLKLEEGAQLIIENSNIAACNSSSDWWGIIRHENSNVEIGSKSSVSNSYLGKYSKGQQSPNSLYQLYKYLYYSYLE